MWLQIKKRCIFQLWQSKELYVCLVGINNFILHFHFLSLFISFCICKFSPRYRQWMKYYINRVFTTFFDGRIILFPVFFFYTYIGPAWWAVLQFQINYSTFGKWQIYCGNASSFWSRGEMKNILHFWCFSVRVKKGFFGLNISEFSLKVIALLQSSIFKWG